jgi:thiaminase/transcriptional activator TenA
MPVNDAGSDPDLRPPGSLTAALWDSSIDIYEQILGHPFLRGIADGTLEEERFAFFLGQDGHYVRSFTQCLSLLAGRAPDDATTTMLVSHAVGAIGLEAALHVELIESMGMRAADVTGMEPSPTTEAYKNSLLASCHRGSFLEALVALLPCYWIYARVGTHLLQVGTPHPVYARWIDNYAGSDYDTAVVDVLECVDSLGMASGTAERNRCLARYRRGAQYEWMFWDAANRLEPWPV